jgi:hypothetical protein
VSTGIGQAKQAIRTRVWDLLTQERVAESGVLGYIPTFAGANAAAPTDPLGKELIKIHDIARVGAPTMVALPAGPPF